MIVLDTNVVSELMQSAPNEQVVACLDEWPSQSVWTTNVTVYEVRFGLEVMAAGRKCQRLESRFSIVLDDRLAGRVLDLNPDAAMAAAVSAKLRAAGRPIEVRDAMIAGIVAARRGTLATRNAKHFADTGIALTDPWQA